MADSPATTPAKGSVEEAAQALMARLTDTSDTQTPPDSPAAHAAPEDQPALEAAPEPEAGTETPDTPATPETPVYKVRVEGEDLEVPLDELIKGYSRTADYTRKTQAVAEVRKAAEAEAQAVREARNQYAGLLDQVQTALQALTPQEPNWADLRATLSPKDYANAQDTWREQSRRLDALKQERERVTRQQAEDAQKQVQTFLRDEQDKLLNAVPEWRDSTKAQTERQQLLDYAKARGFAEDDLKQVHDHRLWLVLRDAARWHQANAKRPTAPAKPALKTASPGSPQSKPKTAAADEAMAKLRKTGRQSDAASALLAAMGDRL